MELVKIGQRRHMLGPQEAGKCIGVLKGCICIITHGHAALINEGKIKRIESQIIDIIFLAESEVIIV